MTHELSIDEAHTQRSKLLFKEYKSSDSFATSAEGAHDATRIYLNEIGYYALLTPEEEKYFARKALDGDRNARNRMIESNLRLVVKIARRYANRGLTILDLIEEGNLGLIHAVSKFDPEKGFRFSTYGVWWIRQTIERAIMNQTRTIRLPIHVTKELNTQLKAAKELSQKLDHEPSLEEIAEYLDKPIERVGELLRINQKVGSVDTTISSESDATLLESIPDTGNHGPEQTLLDSDLMSNMEQWIDRLTPIQQAVICRRFGLRGHEAGTLESVGNEVGLTREKVRQTQVEALRSLRRRLASEGLEHQDVTDAKL